MAKISIEYDTDTRKAVAMLDGEELTDLMEAVCYKDDYSGNFSVSLVRHRKDPERKMAFTERISASNKLKITRDDDDFGAGFIKQFQADMLKRLQ